MKAIKRFIALGLALLLLLPCFVGCSSKGPKMLELGDSEISLNLFYFYLSRMKGTYCAINGISENDDSHWDSIMDSSGKTYNEYYTEFVLNEVKNLLVAVHFFEELDLELPDSEVDAIDAEIERMIEEEANGSKSQFNKMLANYGANTAVLREAYIIEKKVEYLKNHLYGANGERIGADMYNEYYQKNYARFKHILFETYEYKFVTDQYGDPVYYKGTTGNSIAYKETAFTNGTDKNGDTIFLTEENGKISYDTENGKKRVETDENGEKVTIPLSGEALDRKIAEVKAMHGALAAGSYAVFDAKMAEHNEEWDLEESYPNGYYVTKTTETSWNAIRDKVFTMKVGEIAELETEFGIHIIMRYELEDLGYNNDLNKDFFYSTVTGQYLFLPSLKQYLLSEKVKPELEKITIKEKIYQKADMKSVKPNFYY